ncbi:MAG: lactoylglutathione lyase [Gammaproteobacteria bacterium]|nr:lactoylglutathione lyase [Gammaproteobacteria bacterium]
MNDKITNSDMPSRILYTMIRIGDLERSIKFYKNVLGMHELRRENFTGGRFTLVFMGYGNESSNAVIELTYNWDEDTYDIGTGYGHMALQVADIYLACDRLKKMGVKIVLEPGPMTYPVDETGHKETIAFIEDPDDYKIELIEHKQ